MKTTTLTTFSKLLPASSKTAFTFSKDCLVAAFISVTTSPVAGLTGICPDVNTISPILIPC